MLYDKGIIDLFILQKKFKHGYKFPTFIGWANR